MSNGVPIEADTRGLIYSLAVESGGAATYDAMQQLYVGVRPYTVLCCYSLQRFIFDKLCACLGNE